MRLKTIRKMENCERQCVDEERKTRETENGRSAICRNTASRVGLARSLVGRR